MLRKVLASLFVIALMLSNVSATWAQTVISTPTFVVSNQLITSPIEAPAEAWVAPVYDVSNNPCWGGVSISAATPKPIECTGWDGPETGKITLEFWVTKDRINSWGSPQVAWFWNFYNVRVIFQDGHEIYNQQFVLNEGVYVVELWGPGHLGIAPASAGTPDKYVDYTPQEQFQPQNLVFLVKGTAQKPVKTELRVEGVLITTTVEVTTSVTFTVPVVLRKNFNAISLFNANEPALIPGGSSQVAYPIQGFLFTQNPKVEYIYLPVIIR